jgi:hypothetical protein
MKAGAPIGYILCVDFTAMSFYNRATIATPIPSPQDIARDGEPGNHSLYGPVAKPEVI